MREDLLKAYDIIIENQRNADNKAYIFIAVITAFLTFMNEIPLAVFPESQRVAMEYIFYITLIPLLAFIMSLIPKYSNEFDLKLKKKLKIKLNIFYWKSILNFENEFKFVEEYKDRYQVKELSKTESDFLSQIYVNSKILEYKKQFHSLAFIVLTQFMILVLVSIFGILVLNSNVLLTGILLLIVEILFIINLLNINIFKKKIN
jgi:hypothetical protein